MKSKMSGIKEIKTNSEMLLDVRDRPKIKTWLMLSMQHVFAMFGATVLVPMITGIDVSVALFSSGVGTLIYIVLTRARVPIYLGSSFAYIGAILSMHTLYGSSTFLGFLGVGLIYAIVAINIYFFGTKWIKKLLPPIVVGPMIIVIGLSLAHNAINSIGINDVNNIDWNGLLVAIITAGTAMFTSLFFRGKMKLLPILIAMIVGFVASLIVSSWHSGFINYSAKDWTSVSTYIGTPDFTKGLFSGSAFNITGWYIPFFLMMPIAFVTIAEHIGDHTVLGKITGRDYINGTPGLHKTLLGDGIATAFAGAIGGPANTSYGENTTTVGISRVASVYVTGLAATFAIMMSFFSIVSSCISLIPPQVAGGLEIILFGFIATNGLKVLIDEKIDMYQVRNVFIVASMLVIGIGGAVIGGQISSVTIQFSGTSLAMVVGVATNLLLPKDRGIDENKMPKVKGQRPDITNHF